MTYKSNEVEATLRLALEALESCDAAHITDGGRQWYDEKLVDKAITAIKEALAQPEQEPENRCVRELREFAKSNQGAYIFPSWDGNRVLKYLGDTTPPQRTWVGLTDEEIARVVSLAGFAPDWAEAHIATQIVRVLEAKLKEKNT